jgi:hypothetical protein
MFFVSLDSKDKAGILQLDRKLLFHVRGDSATFYQNLPPSFLMALVARMTCTQSVFPKV